MALHSLIIFGLVRRVLVICGEYYTRQMFINLSALSISVNPGLSTPEKRQSSLEFETKLSTIGAVS